MDENPLQFAQPIWIFIGLLACAGMVGLFVRFDRRRELDLTKLIHPRFRQRLTEGFSPWRRNLKRGLWLLAVALIFTAIARPQKGYEWQEVKRKGIDILFAVDTSRSMLAEDLMPNRLERARLGIVDFVARLESDRVGLIPFAGSAFALCPLTLDYDAFRESLDALDTDLIPRQGTDLASAIKEAERLFDEDKNNHRVLVLMTDGEDLQGSVIDAAKAAAKKGMAIYTIGVGGAEGAMIPIRYQNGRTDYVRDADGNVVRTKLDETTLKKIAEETNGLYVPLGRGAEGLNTIYQERLRLVPQSEMSQRMERIPLERFEWPLGAAVVLLLMEFFIGDRRRAGGGRGAAKMIPVVALGFVLFAGMCEVRASEDPRKTYNIGTNAYSEGDFTKASESLRASLRTPDLALQQRSYYNLGNTLYRTGQAALEKDPKATMKSWEEAVKAYDDALALDATDEDSIFNKALVERKLEELKQQQQDEKKDDEKKDEQKKDEQKKDEQKKDEQKKDGEKKDQKEGEDPKEEKAKESDKEGNSGDPKDEKEGEEPKPGEKPKEGKDPAEGDSKPADEREGADKPSEQEEGTVGEERREKQEMSPEEARQLLDALRGDERTVVPIPQAPRGGRTDNTIKGKTW